MNPIAALMDDNPASMPPFGAVSFSLDALWAA